MNAKHKNGDYEARLGQQSFEREDYDRAAQHFAAAVEAQTDNADWREMRELAEANASARIQIAVPDPHYFDEEELLTSPRVLRGSLPNDAIPESRSTLLAALRQAISDVLGGLVSLLFGALTQLWGRAVGYSGEVWTNWYERRRPFGILTLAYMRDQLNSNNLKSTYPKHRLIGFQKDRQPHPPGVIHFRTADGSWNNLANPMEGAAGTRFTRNVDNAAISAEKRRALMIPNPREVSRKLLTRQGKTQEIDFLNMLAAVWIQFQNHDWISHGDNVAQDPYEIPLAKDDPLRRKFGQKTMRVARTQPDPTRKGDDQTPVTFINEVTHWWDGSQIYGSDQVTQERLRSGVDGKLKLNEDGTLPLDRNGVEDTGMLRNWWLGLSMMHLLFVKEHNAICNELKNAWPRWDDCRLFNVARLINAAVMAKIHTVEWTPAILPNPTLDLALNANWYGILTNLFRIRGHRKTLADINVHNPEMGGVVGNPINKHGCPYALTEEFVEVYRLHSMLPERLRIQHIDDDVTWEIPFPATRQSGSRKITEKIAMADLFFSFGNQLPGQLVLNNYPKFLQELSVPGFPLLDLGTVDILRARERGVPRYNEFRRQLGLKPIRNFDDLTEDPEVVRQLLDVYGEQPEDVEKLDLMIGTLSEGEHQRPTGFGFGETMFQIFILNATRRLQADRFYTDNYNEQTYTAQGLDWIDRANFKCVLLRHFPALSATGLANVRNAFEPWDNDEQLERKRHPLREWDRELRKDPWRGDAWR